MVSHQYRCICIHIPKTAGKRVQKCFGLDSWQKHKDLCRYARELGPRVFASYYKFTMVRNPWERLLSDYNFQQKKDAPAGQKLFTRDERGRRRRFHEWVEAVLSDPWRYGPDQWGAEVSADIHRWSPQLDWISLEGKVAVDRVLRLENLPEDFTALCRRLGLPSRELPCCNWKFHWHYSHHYDGATQRWVEQYYEKDIETFRYRFDSGRGTFRWLVPERLGVLLRGRVRARLGQARGKGG